MPQLDPPDPYRDAVRRLRASFGNQSDDLPLGVIRRLLTLLGEAEPRWGDAEVKWGERGRTSGSFVVLAERRILMGDWENATMRGYASREYGEEVVSIRVAARSALRAVELPSSPGAWSVRDDAQQPEPWEYGGRVRLSYDGLDQALELPLRARVPQMEFQPVLQELLNDLG